MPMDTAGSIRRKRSQRFPEWQAINPQNYQRMQQQHMVQPPMPNHQMVANMVQQVLAGLLSNNKRSEMRRPSPLECLEQRFQRSKKSQRNFILTLPNDPNKDSGLSKRDIMVKKMVDKPGQNNDFQESDRVSIRVINTCETISPWNTLPVALPSSRVSASCTRFGRIQSPFLLMKNEKSLGCFFPCSFKSNGNEILI